jgi:hypothetical protein
MEDDMTEEEQRRAADLAQTTALTELVRLAVAEMAFASNTKSFRTNLSVIEKVAIEALRSRPLLGEADDATEAFVKEAASGFIKHLIASIQYPGDIKPD